MRFSMAALVLVTLMPLASLGADDPRVQEFENACADMAPLDPAFEIICPNWAKENSPEELAKTQTPALKALSQKVQEVGKEAAQLALTDCLAASVRKEFTPTDALFCVAVGAKGNLEALSNGSARPPDYAKWINENERAPREVRIRSANTVGWVGTAIA